MNRSQRSATVVAVRSALVLFKRVLAEEANALLEVGRLRPRRRRLPFRKPAYREPTLAPAARPIVQNEGPRARGCHPAAEAFHVLIVKNPVSAGGRLEPFTRPSVSL